MHPEEQIAEQVYVLLPPRLLVPSQGSKVMGYIASYRTADDPFGWVDIEATALVKKPDVLIPGAFVDDFAVWAQVPSRVFNAYNLKHFASLQEWQLIRREYSEPAANGDVTAQDSLAQPVTAAITTFGSALNREGGGWLRQDTAAFLVLRSHEQLKLGDLLSSEGQRFQVTRISPRGPFSEVLAVAA
jgi:hypothetical protein